MQIKKKPDLGVFLTFENIYRLLYMHSTREQESWSVMHMKVEKDELTTTHDLLITDAKRWSEALGYVVDKPHLGHSKGFDAVFKNGRRQVVLEIVTGTDFTRFFMRKSIRNLLIPVGKYSAPPETSIIVVADRIDNVKEHGISTGLPEGLFGPPKQKVFPLITRDFDRLFPVLLVSLLGARENIDC
jgi:hypothetical protein